MCRPILDPDESTTDALSVVPANEASWEDLRAIFGVRGDAASCRVLVRAAVDHARRRGAREGYPMITEPGQEITWGEMHVGSRSVFEDAGFSEVTHPTLRRVVMRIDF